MNTLDDLVKLKDEYDKKIKENGEAILKNAFKEIFDSAKDLQALRWQQYTPYFADGDPCVFGVGDVQYLTGNDQSISENDDDESLDEYDWRDSWYGEKETDTAKIVNEFNGKISKLTDCLEAIYGDHVQVTVLKNKIIVDEYMHD